MKVTIAALITMLVTSSALADSVPSEHLEYAEFISLVEQGKVSTIVFDGSSLSTAEITHSDGIRSVSVNLPWHSESKPDPLLVRLLDSHDVTLKQVATAQTQWGMVSSMVLMWGFPLLNFVLIVILHLRFSKLRKTMRG